MGDLTKNISRHELKCKCGKCDYTSMDYETILVVQDACDHFAKLQGVERVRLNITSAARCPEYNKKPMSEGGPGSNDASQHPRSCAMDISIEGVSCESLYNYFKQKYPDKFGIGLYKTFVHIDTKQRPVRRW